MQPAHELIASSKATGRFCECRLASPWGRAGSARSWRADLPGAVGADVKRGQGRARLQQQPARGQIARTRAGLIAARVPDAAVQPAPRAGGRDPGRSQSTERRRGLGGDTSCRREQLCGSCEPGRRRNHRSVERGPPTRPACAGNGASTAAAQSGRRRPASSVTRSRSEQAAHRPFGDGSGRAALVGTRSSCSARLMSTRADHLALDPGGGRTPLPAVKTERRATDPASRDRRLSAAGVVASSLCPNECNTVTGSRSKDTDRGAPTGRLCARPPLATANTEITP